MSNRESDTGAQVALETAEDHDDFGATDRGKRILLRLAGSLASAAVGAGFVFLAHSAVESNLAIAMIASVIAVLFFWLSWWLIRPGSVAHPERNAS